MTTKNIRWSTRAKDEFAEIKKYFDKRNGSSAYSKKLFQKITHSLHLTRQQEERGEKLENGDLRYVVVEKYQIFYQIKKNAIVLVSIWDSRRNPDDLKFD